MMCKKRCFDSATLRANADMVQLSWMTSVGSITKHAVNKQTSVCHVYRKCSSLETGPSVLECVSKAPVRHPKEASGSVGETAVGGMGNKKGLQQGDRLRCSLSAAVSAALWRS